MFRRKKDAEELSCGFEDCAYFPFFEYTIASNKTHANRILQDFTTDKQLFTF